MALLEADVNYKVVKSFIAGVQEAALGESVIKSVSSAQQFIKIVHNNLVDILGGKDYTPSLPLKPIPPTIIMLSGLQGSGKTTSAGKLGRYFATDGKNVLLIAADIYRSAAIDQLEVLGKNLNINVYSDKKFKVSELRQKLLTIIPRYEMPAKYYHLEKMPLTGNGKIDRQYLNRQMCGEI